MRLSGVFIVQLYIQYRRIKQSDVQNVNMKEIKNAKEIGGIRITRRSKLTFKSLKSQFPCGFRGFLLYSYIYSIGDNQTVRCAECQHKHLQQLWRESKRRQNMS